MVHVHCSNVLFIVADSAVMAHQHQQNVLNSGTLALPALSPSERLGLIDAFTVSCNAGLPRVMYAGQLDPIHDHVMYIQNVPPPPPTASNAYEAAYAVDCVAPTPAFHVEDSCVHYLAHCTEKHLQIHLIAMLHHAVAASVTHVNVSAIPHAAPCANDAEGEVRIAQALIRLELDSAAHAEALIQHGTVVNVVDYAQPWMRRFGQVLNGLIQCTVWQTHYFDVDEDQMNAAFMNLRRGAMHAMVMHLTGVDAISFDTQSNDSV